MTKFLNYALSDVVNGVRMSRVWLALATEDIGDQHRRTRLGPLWLLINYLAFSLTFIFIFKPAGADGQPDYASYVACGLLIWSFLMEVVTQSVTLFVREENFIKGTTLPLTVYVMRMTAQATLRGCYSLTGCLAIVLISGTEPSLIWLWSALGLAIIIIATPAAITILAFMGAFFPDSQFILSNAMRLGMFITPVFWSVGDAGGLRHALYHWNPFTYLIEIVRLPITSEVVPVTAIAFCVVLTTGLWILAVFLLARLRRQLVFVL